MCLKVCKSRLVKSNNNKIREESGEKSMDGKLANFFQNIERCKYAELNIVNEKLGHSPIL